MTDAPTPQLRFAVLQHSGVDEPHYDLLFETAPGSGLATYRLASWPARCDQPALKLRDHRRIYLDYEGVVPGHRGRVDRVADGRVQVRPLAGGWLLSQPDGTPFLLLEPPADPSEPDRWTLRLPGG